MCTFVRKGKIINNKGVLFYLLLDLNAVMTSACSVQTHVSSVNLTIKVTLVQHSPLNLDQCMYLLFVFERKNAGNFVWVILIIEAPVISLNARKTSEMFGINTVSRQKLYI
jgi:hypothetical protein